MPVLGLHHINIRTPDYAATLTFMRDALGFRIEPVRGTTSVSQSAWIIDNNDVAVLHLAAAQVPYAAGEVLPDPPPRGSGAIHHIALRCRDLDEMRRGFAANGIDFRENQPEPGVCQLFVFDPSGIRFELNFET